MKRKQKPAKKATGGSRAGWRALSEHIFRVVDDPKAYSSGFETGRKWIGPEKAANPYIGTPVEASWEAGYREGLAAR